MHASFSSLRAPCAAAGALAIAAFAVSAGGCGSSAKEGPPGGAPPPGAQSEALASASDGGAAEQGRHGHHVPPPAAFDACKDKAAGDGCTVAWHDRTIEGTCATPPSDSTQTGLACRPEHRHHGPPPEIVLAACDGKAAGDPCSVSFERGTVEGSCLAPRFVDAGAGRLLCAPARAHGRHGGDR